MKVVVNNVIPFKGFLAVNLFGVVSARKEPWRKLETWDRLRVINHESIHTAQMDDFALFLKWCPPLQRIVGGFVFYILYFLEWVYRLIFHTRTAYSGISFEKEAYAWETDMTYLKNRKHFAQWRKH